MNFNKALQVIEEEVCNLIESSNSILVAKCNKLLKNRMAKIFIAMTANIRQPKNLA